MILTLCCIFFFRYFDIWLFVPRFLTATTTTRSNLIPKSQPTLDTRRLNRVIDWIVNVQTHKTKQPNDRTNNTHTHAILLCDRQGDTDIRQQEKNLSKAAKVLGETTSLLHTRETSTKTKVNDAQTTKTGPEPKQRMNAFWNYVCVSCFLMLCVRIKQHFSLGRCKHLHFIPNLLHRTTTLH